MRDRFVSYFGWVYYSRGRSPRAGSISRTVYVRTAPGPSPGDCPCKFCTLQLLIYSSRGSRPFVFPSRKVLSPASPSLCWRRRGRVLRRRPLRAGRRPGSTARCGCCYAGSDWTSSIQSGSRGFGGQVKFLPRIPFPDNYWFIIFFVETFPAPVKWRCYCSLVRSQLSQHLSHAGLFCDPVKKLRFYCSATQNSLSADLAAAAAATWLTSISIYLSVCLRTFCWRF